MVGFPKALSSTRTVILVLAGVGPALAGCANEIGPQKLGGPIALSAKAMAAAPTPAAQPLIESEALRRGAHSDRVLSAIALERVTGRRPDASRLVPKQ